MTLTAGHGVSKFSSSAQRRRGASTADEGRAIGRRLTSFSLAVQSGGATMTPALPVLSGSDTILTMKRRRALDERVQPGS